MYYRFIMLLRVYRIAPSNIFSKYVYLLYRFKYRKFLALVPELAPHANQNQKEEILVNTIWNVMLVLFEAGNITHF